MKGEVAVGFRVLAYVVFSALGSFLVARGVLTEDQALALVSDEFLGVVVTVVGAGGTYLYYRRFSEASRALFWWRSADAE